LPTSGPGVSCNVRRAVCVGVVITLAFGWGTPSALGDSVADEDAAALANGASTTLPAEPDAAGSATVPTLPAAPDPAPAPPAEPDPAAVPPAAADPAGPPIPDQPVSATTAAGDGAAAGPGDGMTAPATKKQNQPAKGAAEVPATTQKRRQPTKTTPPAGAPTATKNQTAPATASGPSTQSGASTAKDDPPRGASTPANKDPNASGPVAPSPASGDRPPTDAQGQGASPAPDPSQADEAAPPTASPSVSAQGVSTPATVSTPAMVAHRSERSAAPRAAPPSLDRAFADHDQASGRVAVTLAGLRPATPGTLVSQTPILASPILSAPAASPTEAAAPAHARAHRAKPARAGPAVHHQPPVSPFAPPQRGPVSVAGSAPSSGGGASAAMWCAVICGFLLYAARDLRRHRGHLLLAGPAGVPSPQQRPG
jgi:hypothetical protein